MRRLLPWLTVLSLITAGFCHAQSFAGGGQNAAMQKAIAEAQATLPKFWEVFAKPGPGDSDFCLKFKVTDLKGVEYFWVTEPEKSGGRILGTISNDPAVVKSVKAGQRIAVTEKEVADWMFRRDGKVMGNFTLRVLLPMMPPEDAAQLKSILAESPVP